MTTMITQNPYSVKSVGDDSIIVDMDCYIMTKARLELEVDLQRSFTSIEQIVLLSPLQVIKPDLLIISTKYPYINLKSDYAVQNVRPHLRMDFKSRSKISYFDFN
jgi:hypothetical protein